MKIIDKLDVLLPAFDTDTRIYGVLDYLQQTMIQMIPEEPTVIQELNLEGLFGELLDEDEHDSVGIAWSAMNQGEMQNADEKKLDLGDNETDQIGQESENSELDSEEDEQQEQELNEVEQRHLLRQQQKDEYEQERLEYHKQEYEKRHAWKQYFYEFN